jgi:hypothetical protein
MRREAAWSELVSACDGLTPSELRALATYARRMAETPRMEWAKLPRRADRPRCGARCRTKGGAPCVAPVVIHRSVDGRLRVRTRCKLHGGASTGPTTPEGLRRCVEAGRRGAAARWRRCHDSAERIDSGADDATMHP